MNKLNLFLVAVLTSFSSGLVYADENLIRFVEYDVAKSVLEQHFGNVTQSIPSGFSAKYDDTKILNNAAEKYNKMLSENDGFVSADAAVDLCVDVFNDALESNDIEAKSDYIAKNCYSFIDDLVTTQAPQSASEQDCKYEISMAPNKFHVKYTNKQDGHGFIRHCPSYIGWRNFNPGNLVESPYKCSKVGGMAVFENEEIGFKAIAHQLTATNRYKNLTLRQAIPIYATTAKDPNAYIAFLSKQGIDVDKKLSTFKDKELDKMVHAMAQKEGWFNGVKACQGNENAPNIADRKGVEYF